jgi:type II secretion system protein I
MMQTSKAGILTVSRATRAFTLIEVLVALAIASIGLLSLLRLHLASMATAQAAAIETAAVFVAQEKTTEASTAGYPPLASRSGITERNGMTFEWTTSVTEAHPQIAPGRTLSGVREIRTRVSWPHGSGQKEVQMTTYAAESRFVE